MLRHSLDQLDRSAFVYFLFERLPCVELRAVGKRVVVPREKSVGRGEDAGEVFWNGEDGMEEGREGEVEQRSVVLARKGGERGGDAKVDSFDSPVITPV